MLVGKEKDIQLIKKRILSGLIDFFAYILLFGLSSKLISQIFILYIEWISILCLAGEFMIYFTFIPKITNGYTLGYYLTRIKLVPINNNIKISLLLKRILAASLFYFKTFGLRKIKFNSLGQFDYDEKYAFRIIHVNDKKNEKANGNNDVAY